MDISKDVATNLASHEGLVISMVRNYISNSSRQKYLDYQELQHYARLGLLKAILRYKPDSKGQFSSYAYRYILGAIVDNQYLEAGIKRSHMRKAAKSGEDYKYPLSLETKVPNDLNKTETTLFRDTLVDETDILGDLVKKEEIEILLKAFKQLSEYHQFLLTIRFYEKMKYEDIGYMIKRNDTTALLHVRVAVNSLKGIIEQN